MTATPPMPSHSERAILGCVMIHPNAMETIAVRASDFSDERHVYTWQLMTARHGRGLPRDMCSLVECLEEEQEIAKVGGLAYVSSHGDVACV